MAAVQRLISTLEECRKAKDEACTRELYAYMCENGVEVHEGVANHLVRTLVECGSLADAQLVHTRFASRKLQTWNCLILGYAESGDSKQVFHLYQGMQEDHVQPNHCTFLALLKLCARLRDATRGHWVHSQIVKFELERHPHVGNCLIDFYVKCGSLTEVQQLFIKLPDQDTVSWNILLSGYGGGGLSEEVLNCFMKMHLSGYAPDSVTYICTLEACGSIRSIERSQQMYAQVTLKGLESDLYVGSTAIDMFAKCRCLQEANGVFDLLPQRNVVSWTSLIDGYIENGFCDQALMLYRQMQQEGVFPDAVISFCGLKACGGVRALESGLIIHCEIAKKGWERDFYAAATMVDMYGKCGLLGEASNVFDKLQTHNIVVWNALLAAYIEHGCGEEAIFYFEQMQPKGVSPVSVTFICCLKACSMVGDVENGKRVYLQVTAKGLECDLSIGNTAVDMFVKCGLLMEAQKVFYKMDVRDVVSWNTFLTGLVELGYGQDTLTGLEHMQAHGILPDAVSFICTLQASGSVGTLETGRHIHAEILKRGIEGELHIGDSLLDMYATCGSLIDAQHVLDNLPARDCVSWATLIAGYAEQGYAEHVLICLGRMQREGVSVDAVTTIHCLKACGAVGALEVGQEIHSKILKLGWEEDHFLGNMLVDTYGACGLVMEGRHVFDRLLGRDVVSWNAMIKAYGENHEFLLALKCFEEMQQQGLMPDIVTFTCLLVACSHGSLALEGWKCFKAMEGLNMQPSLDHIVCMTDLLARSGLMKEAFSFAKAMQSPLSREIPMVLLSACRIFGELELGQICYAQLVDMNPQDASGYLLMSEMYASSGKWKEASWIEELRENRGAKKTPASALIEVNKMVHQFLACDIQSKNETFICGTLSFRLREKGYVANLDLITRYGFVGDNNATL